ncbi:MAG: FAD/NAD(P)-binding protein [Burkholderiaceae bacterium]
MKKPVLGMRRIVILGGGFSGAAAAIHLSRAAREPLELTVVEPRAQVGGGVAHSTPHPHHRLNGPDSIHAIYPDEPQHFADWLRDSGALTADPDAVAANGLVFPRRLDFGRYMAAEFERHVRGNRSASTITHLRQRAVRIVGGADAMEVRLDDGRSLHADACILALGWNAIGVPPQLAALTTHPAWVGEPWDQSRMAAVAADATVLLVGAGLTAADAFSALVQRGHRGPVHALSRRGLQPASQNPYRSTVGLWERLDDPDPPFTRRHGRPASMREALRALRSDIAGIDTSCASWHGVFDELRDAARHFWPSLPLAEKRRFVRHLKSRYDAYRFRNPPQVERIIAQGLSDGQLRFEAGRLRAAMPVAGGGSGSSGDSGGGNSDGGSSDGGSSDGGSRSDVDVEFDERGSGRRRVLRVQAIINCTGPEPRPSRSGNPLWLNLIDDGLAREHATGLGIDVDEHGRVVGADGRPAAALFAVGPAVIGALGETIAVPYILRHLLHITARIADDRG